MSLFHGPPHRHRQAAGSVKVLFWLLPPVVQKTRNQISRRYPRFYSQQSVGYIPISGHFGVNFTRKKRRSQGSGDGDEICHRRVPGHVGPLPKMKPSRFLPILFLKGPSQTLDRQSCLALTTKDYNLLLKTLHIPSKACDVFIFI